MCSQGKKCFKRDRSVYLKMTKYALMKKTLLHEPTKQVPYAIALTQRGYDAYGDRILADFPNRQIENDLSSGRITKEQAVNLSIGNHLLYVFPPWWGFHAVDDVFTKEHPPDCLPGIVEWGDYEAFFSQINYIRENYDVFLVATIWASHWEKGYMLRGIENFLVDLALWFPGRSACRSAQSDRADERQRRIYHGAVTGNPDRCKL